MYINEMGSYPVDVSIPLCKRTGGLVSGAVPEDVFWLLIEISVIRSEKMIKALKDYFVDGKSRKDICEEHKVNNGYLSTSISRVERVHYIVKQLSSLYSAYKI